MQIKIKIKDKKISERDYRNIMIVVRCEKNK